MMKKFVQCEKRGKGQLVELRLLEYSLSYTYGT